MACEDCPDKLLPHAERRLEELDELKRQAMTALIRCTLRDKLSGRKGRIEARLDDLERTENYVETMTPERVRDAAETCDGPFERTLERHNTTYRERICGARVLKFVESLELEGQDKA